MPGARSASNASQYREPVDCGRRRIEQSEAGEADWAWLFGSVENLGEHAALDIGQRDVEQPRDRRCDIEVAHALEAHATFDAGAADEENPNELRVARLIPVRAAVVRRGADELDGANTDVIWDYRSRLLELGVTVKRPLEYLRGFTFPLSPANLGFLGPDDILNLIDRA